MFPLDPEAEEYAVEGKTNARLLRQSDGVPHCSHGCLCWLLFNNVCRPSAGGHCQFGLRFEVTSRGPKSTLQN